MRFSFAIPLFLLYVAASCLGLYLIKATCEWRSIQFFSGVGLYGIGAVLWLVILRFFPLSFAFPIAAGGLIVSTTAIGWVFLSEDVSVYQLGGAILIISGIFITAIGKS